MADGLQWVPVDERLPPHGKAVLATDGGEVRLLDVDYSSGNPKNLWHDPAAVVPSFFFEPTHWLDGMGDVPFPLPGWEKHFTWFHPPDDVQGESPAEPKVNDFFDDYDNGGCVVVAGIGYPDFANSAPSASAAAP